MQSSVSVIFLFICKKMNLLNYRSLNKKDATIWLPVSLLLIAMIYTGSVSLQYLTVAMFTVFKNVTIVFIAIAERSIFGNSITSLMWLSFSLIISSSIIGGYFDLVFNLPGYLWMVSNCFSNATFVLYMRSSIKKVNFKDFDSVYYSNSLSIPIMLCLSFLLEDWRGFYADYFGQGPLVAKRISLFSGIIMSSCSAFAISYCTAWSIRTCNSTTYSMVGALNKLPIAISGMLFFENERKVTGWGNILSICIAFSSGIVYSIAQIRKRAAISNTKQSPPPPSSPQIKDGNNDITERTFLNIETKK